MDKIGKNRTGKREGDRTRKMKGMRENGGDTGRTQAQGDNHRRTKVVTNFIKNNYLSSPTSDSFIALNI